MRNFFLAGIILALTVVTAHAGDGMLKFEDVDANADKVITVEEASSSSWLSEQFKEADINKDGELDKAEFETILKSSNM